MITATTKKLADGAILRTAEPRDVPQILELIHGLAEYEHEPDAVKTTEAMLHGVLFGDDSIVSAHVVENDGVLRGIAVWYRTYSTWEGVYGIYLEDLFVLPDHRGSGYGKALLKSLAEVADANGYARVEWAVLNWNEPSIGFYRSIGGKPLDDWTTYRLTGDALAEFSK